MGDWYNWSDLQAQLARIENSQHWIMRELLQTERAIKVAYEAELDAAEAVTALIAGLKTTGTDPATAKRITDLSAALTARGAQLAAAAAAVPTT